MAKKRKLAPKSEPEPSNVSEQQQQQQQQQQEQEDETNNFNQEEEEQIVYEKVAEVEEIEEEVEAEDPEVEDEEEEEEAPTASGPSIVNTDPSADPEEEEDHDEDDDDDEEESAQKLIEPFSKDQIVNLLCQAAEKHPDVYASIRELADSDPSHRKIFVHGLGWDTNAETLTNVFKQYGEIEDCKAVCDKISGKSKGYGFILFKRRSGARKALEEPQKRIGNRMTACQLASAGPVPPPAPPTQVASSEYTQRKIYVSNVASDIDPQSLLNFFSKFGEIEEGPLGLDKQTGKPKGFTLFVYKSPESAKKALEEPHKKFEGHILHCQKAIDGPKPTKPYQQHQQHQHHHQHQNRQPGSGHGSHFPRNENTNFMGAMGNTAQAGHMMAPAGVPFNQGTQQALNPVLGQAISALLATQGGTGLGLTNLLGTLGSAGMGAPVNQNVPPMVNNPIQGGYGNQPVTSVMGGYGSQAGVQGGYQNPQLGQANAGRSQQGGAGHMGGVNPYMGH